MILETATTTSAARTAATAAATGDYTEHIVAASEIPRCHMCFGQILTTVIVDQMNSPGARVRNVNGTDSLVVGVDLRFTFLDENGDPLIATVSESVQPEVTHATGAVPLNGQGQGGDLVSNSFGAVPESASDQRNAIQFFNKEFMTNQVVTFTVVPDNGIGGTVTQQRTLTNMVPGAPPIAGGAIRGYTFTMETPKIRVP